MEQKDIDEQILRRSNELFSTDLDRLHSQTDRLMAILLGLQWVFGVFIAFVVSPRTWAGAESTISFNIYAAIFFGGAITIFPIVLVKWQPGHALTRHVLAASQMLWSALLIH